MKLTSCDKSYGSFEHVFQEILDKYAPLKKKALRSNHAPFMNRNLRKATMLRSRLKNKNPLRTGTNFENSEPNVLRFSE